MIAASSMRCSSPRRSPKPKRSLERKSSLARTCVADSKTSTFDAARLKELGLDGFAAPFKTTCADHNSHSATFVQQWDGAKWVKVSDSIAPDSAKVQPLLDEAAKAYAEKNGLAGAHRAVRQQVSCKLPFPPPGEGSRRRRPFMLLQGPG